LSKVTSPKLVYILKAIDITLGEQKAKTVNFMLNSLFSKEFDFNPRSHLEPRDKKSLLFNQAF
jgi:hypothetical protein